MKLIRFQMKWILTIVGFFVSVFFFQNCGNVGIQRTLLEGQSLGPGPAAPPAAQTIGNPYINCSRTWKKLASGPTPNTGSSGFDPLIDGNFAYYSQGLGSIQKYDLTTKTVVANFLPAQLVHQGQTCTNTSQSILDSINNKIFLKAVCDLGANNSSDVVFEIDALTMQLTNTKYFGQIFGNFQKSKSGEIYLENGSWNGVAKKYCARIYKRTATDWITVGAENCDAGWGQLLITTKDELYSFSGNYDMKFLNVATNEILPLPIQLNDHITNLTSDLSGNIYFTILKQLTFAIEFWKYDREQKQFTKVGTRPDYNFYNSGNFKYVNNGTFVGYFYKNIPGGSILGLDVSSDLTQWSEHFKSSTQYQSSNGLATTYLIPTGVTVLPQGDIYLSGKLWLGMTLEYQYWRYTCD